MDTSADIEAGLNALPESLEETYLEIYNHIRSLKGNSPQIAEATLMWVLCLKESLTPEKLAVIVSRSVSMGYRELSVETLLKICHNLLVLDRQSNIVRVAHLSVREFLKKRPGIINAHTMASKFCLTYMTIILISCALPPLLMSERHLLSVMSRVIGYTMSGSLDLSINRKPPSFLNYF